MTKLVRSASLTDYLVVARSVGLDPSRMLGRVGLSRRCLQNPDFKIPENAVRELLEVSAAAAGIEDFGLRLAERRALSNLGALGLLVRDQPTVRQALEAWNQYRTVHTDSVSLTIEQRGGDAIVSFVAYLEPLGPSRQAVEMAVGVLYRMMRLFLGDGWKPRVCFAHSAPHNCDTHRRIFGTRVHFDRDFNGIACRSTDLDARIATADPAMARYAQHYIDSIALPDGTFSDKVRKLVRTMLSSGDCRMVRVAEHLGLDRRTVHRRLAEERTSFSAIVDAARTELVNRYIENRERRSLVLAEMLGFSDASAFSRWFKRRFGCSLSAWRATNQRKPQTVH